MSEPKPFKCAACGGIFRTTTTDEEVKEEFDRLFPGNTEKRYVVCHDCWVELTQKPPGATAQ